MWKNCFCCREKELSSRTIWVGREQSSTQKFPPNVIRNQKYSLFSFIPMVRIFKIKVKLQFKITRQIDLVMYVDNMNAAI